jgi:O-antigen/teichoic acid export membrane protein
MLRNGYALIVSAGVTQVIGFVFWIVAALKYPPAVVGRNSAALSVTLFLAGVAELNLMSTLVRFLPTAGRHSARFILTIYAVSAAVAPVTGAVFVLLIPYVAPQLDFMRSSPLLAVWFVVSVVTGAIFVLQDSALTGVRATPFVPVENAVFSVVKLVAMVSLVGVAPAGGIYVSWTAGFALAVIPTNIYLFARAIPRHLRRTPAQGQPPRLRDIRSYLVPDSIAAFFFMACTMLLPLLIIDRLGAAAAGHYAIAWMVAYALYLVSLNMGSSLVVETASAPAEMRARALRSVTHLGKLLVPVVALVIVVGPWALGFFGHSYAISDAWPLRLLALSALPALVTNTAISATRSQRRMRVVAGIQICICAMVWGCSAALMGPLGLTGVGAAWLIAQTVTAAVLLAKPTLWLPAGRLPRHAMKHTARRHSTRGPTPISARTPMGEASP